MTQDRKKTPKPAGKKPSVKKETVKDLDPKQSASDVKGGLSQGCLMVTRRGVCQAD